MQKLHVDGNTVSDATALRRIYYVLLENQNLFPYLIYFRIFAAFLFKIF